jgi:hypothetical protein
MRCLALTELALERGTHRRWRTYGPVTWMVGSKTSGILVTIPAGTEFEISVPWCLRWIIGQDDPCFLLAALVHDWLLESGTYGPAQAAAEWYDGARAAGAPVWKAKASFLAVSVWAVWND